MSLTTTTRSILEIIDDISHIQCNHKNKFPLMSKFKKMVTCTIKRSKTYTGLGDDGYDNVLFTHLTDECDVRGEYIYIITIDDKIVKIGGTRTGIRGRCASYGCGLPKNRINGTCSTTNYNVLVSIYNTIKKGSSVVIWGYAIPKIIIKCDPFEMNENVDVSAQVFHAYETKCMEIFNNCFGNYPYFSKNSDGEYV